MRPYVKYGLDCTGNTDDEYSHDGCHLERAGDQ
jgi:hypothetical protein